MGLAADESVVGTGPAHYPSRIKRIIHLFMNGGVSQMDTFDPKPRLNALEGQRFDPGAGQLVESVTNSPGFKVMPSPFPFKRHGQSGRWVSGVFPHLAGVVDELAFILSMTSPTNVHGLGSYMQNTGFALPGFPSMGSWISYALGSLNDNLPTFIVLPDPKGLPYNNLGNFSSGFLPVKHRGTVIRTKPPSTPIGPTETPSPISILPRKPPISLPKAKRMEGISFDCSIEIINLIGCRMTGWKPGWNPMKWPPACN